MVETELAATIGVFALPATLLLSLLLGVGLYTRGDAPRGRSLLLVFAPILTFIWLLAGGFLVATVYPSDELAWLVYSFGFVVGLFAIAIAMADQARHGRFRYLSAAGVLVCLVAAATSLASVGFYSYLSTCFFNSCE